VSRITELIAKAKAQDAQFGADLEREFRALSSRLSFGLNFERHRPEAVELPQRPVRRGDKVRILPPRGSTVKGDQRLWIVDALHRTKKTADLKLLGPSKSEAQTVAIEDLVVVAEFRDTIYPGLVSTGKVSRGGEKPWHTVINGENYHALKALTWTHRGKIDVIYIDPPYNTGAKDWKYNNDYVEGDDLYRHSKWLAFMERRLLIARELLNPSESVLIVAIDENECLRLGLLLEQIFPEATIQMVTVVINPSGASGEGFSRVEEYLFFVRFGKAVPSKTADNLLTDVEARDGRVKGGLSWESFLRSGVGNTRDARPNLCYPILIDPASQTVVGAGEPLMGPEESRPTKRDGLPLAWPVRSDGRLGMWRRDRESLLELVGKGYAFVSDEDKERGTWSLKYLLSGTINAIETGQIQVTQSGDRGQVIASTTMSKARVAKTVWNRPSHNAGKHGSDLLRALLPDRRFPFPKALYAVEDALRFFSSAKSDPVVLDFFSGSGTTAHAVMRLNRQDGRQRRCISVTNNEVAADEQRVLRQRGLRPGDDGWEMYGICDQITKPRVQAAISGKTPDGDPIRGDYKFTDEFPMADGFAENAEFFTLTYETPIGVSHQTAFARIAPLLWLRAGSEGRRIDKLPAAGWDVVEAYGLLVDLDTATDFLKAARKAKSLSVAFIVTDDERRFQALSRRLPEGVEAVRLYESYLTNFAFANGEGA
jgi:adenine-specific DNA-methyltransferase